MVSSKEWTNTDPKNINIPVLTVFISKLDKFNYPT